MRRVPNTTLLQAFASAGKTGNFARTAVDLNLTASAVSHQISALERWWATRLFERHSRGADLTAAGRLMLPIVTSFFDQMQEAQSQLAGLTAMPIRLRCTSSLCTAWLAPRVHSAGSQGLFGQLILTSGDITDSNLSARDYDLAVTISDARVLNGPFDFLMRDTMFAVCSPAFKRKYKGISVSNMAELPLIHRVDDQICPTWRDWFQYHQAAPHDQRSAPRFPDSMSVINLAVQGRGIALGRAALVYEHLKNGSLVPFTKAVMPSPSAYYVLNRSSRMAPDAARLTHWLKDQAAGFIKNVRVDFPALTPMAS